MRGVAVGEALLLLGLLCLAYCLWLQQDQLAELQVELDKLRGATTGMAKAWAELEQ